MTSTPTEFHSEQLMEMSKNNQNFMKNIPKSDRLEYFAPWVNSEKTQYSVEGNFDIKSKKVFKYNLDVLIYFLYFSLIIRWASVQSTLERNQKLLQN